jgi:hypothetical protein
MVTLADPSMRKLIVSPDMRGRNIRRGVAVGVVTMDSGYDHTALPFFRI